MDNTLIVFASNQGTTEKFAREFFRRINGKVDICNLTPRDFLPDLLKYDSVIIGGSVHGGTMQKEIISFCNDNLEVLLTKRLGLFINCICSDKKAQQQLDRAFPDILTRKAVVRDYFGGELDKLKLSFWERILATRTVNKGDLFVEISREKIKRFAHKMSSGNEMG